MRFHRRALVSATLGSALLITSASLATAADTPAGAYKIGLLLPETAVARYETKDRPFFEAKLKELCPDCEFLYANANSDAAAQQQQADSMLSQGVNVLVVDPLDGVARSDHRGEREGQRCPGRRL